VLAEIQCREGHRGCRRRPSFGDSPFDLRAAGGGEAALEEGSIRSILVAEMLP
jgi:hypothetical protein